ncbi:hypothetical protein BDK51DRAFT_41917 [Blyttiomyces helicus]|uniref:Protein kinase domain-containing protein n=1 Tax=Blyttiomyces helicus TaxID=388810 RepID=A0A4P9W9H1_9FUNG|nr:hypothetical protein BDK51DRAFT_41917 [Blyttiomyces helicus]|eukprot:RKO87768.1 hypothetical protein BDK51DRAFT_41917 [Blyttiomyces helicus]
MGEKIHGRKSVDRIIDFTRLPSRVSQWRLLGPPWDRGQRHPSRTSLQPSKLGDQRLAAAVGQNLVLQRLAHRDDDPEHLPSSAAQGPHQPFAQRNLVILLASSRTDPRDGHEESQEWSPSPPRSRETADMSVTPTLNKLKKNIYPPPSSPQTPRSTLTPALDTTTTPPTRVILKRIASRESAARERDVLRRLAGVAGVVDLVDAWEVDGSADGVEGTVLVLLRMEPLAAKDADLVVVAGWLRAVAETLATAHEAGIIHTSLTASSLMAHPTTSAPTIISWGRTASPLPTNLHPLLPAHPTPPPASTAHMYARVTTPSSPPSARAAEQTTTGAGGGDPLTESGDVFAAGIQLGLWVSAYLPNCSLGYLGSTLLRPSTTTYISRRLADGVAAHRAGTGAAAWHPEVANAADVLGRMLAPDEPAGTRISAADVARHPFCVDPPALFEGTARAEHAAAADLAGRRGARRPSAQGVSERKPKIIMRYR